MLSVAEGYEKSIFMQLGRDLATYLHLEAKLKMFVVIP